MSELLGFRRDFLPDVEWVDDPIRVLLCDDHALYRRGVMVSLEDEPDIEVVGEASSGPEAAALAEVLAPDIVLVDVGLPPYGGVAAAAQMSRAVPSVRMIVMAANERRPDELLEAVGAGAISVILKERTLDEGASVVRRVEQGECVLLPSVAGAIRELLAGQHERVTPGVAPIEVTDRERVVLEIVARGADAADAATGLGIEPHTAVNLMRNLVRKIQRYWRAEDAAVSLSSPRMPDEATLASVTKAAKWLSQEID